MSVSSLLCKVGAFCTTKAYSTKALTIVQCLGYLIRHFQGVFEGVDEASTTKSGRRSFLSCFCFCFFASKTAARLFILCGVRVSKCALCKPIILIHPQLPQDPASNNDCRRTARVLFRLAPPKTTLSAASPPTSRSAAWASKYSTPTTPCLCSPCRAPGFEVAATQAVTKTTTRMGPTCPADTSHARGDRPTQRR